MTATQAEAIAPHAEAEQAHEHLWSPTAWGWAACLTVLGAVSGWILYITAVVPGYWAFLISLAAIWAIIGLSLNVVLGYVGQISLGHHGFIGIGAFAAAYYATKLAGCDVAAVGGQCPVGAFATGTLLAVLTGAFAAGLLGLVALRIRGLYLALITLAFGFMAERSIFEIPALTGGGAGMSAPRPAGFSGDRAFAYLCFVFLAVVIFLDWRLLKSKAGRAILSVKHSEPVAASYGINVTAYKILAFVLSGAFAGLAGSLLAFRRQAVVANDFEFQTALLWVLMVVVGGLGNRTGVVIGSAFFALFPEALKEIGPVERFLVNLLNRDENEITVIAPVVGALLAILTMIQFPGGIAQQISPITRWLRGEKFSMHPEGHGTKKDHKPSPLARFKKAPKETPEPAAGDGSHAAADPSAGAPSSSATSADDAEVEAATTKRTE